MAAARFHIRPEVNRLVRVLIAKCTEAPGELEEYVSSVYAWFDENPPSPEELGFWIGALTFCLEVHCDPETAKQLERGIDTWSLFYEQLSAFEEPARSVRRWQNDKPSP